MKTGFMNCGESRRECLQKLILIFLNLCSAMPAYSSIERIQLYPFCRFHGTCTDVGKLEVTDSFKLSTRTYQSDLLQAVA